jgi:sulfite reductase beta subunit-like hemoprotein
MKRTLIIHNVPASEKESLIADLQSDGYQTTTIQEPDGEYTVIGTKNVNS